MHALACMRDHDDHDIMPTCIIFEDLTLKVVTIRRVLRSSLSYRRPSTESKLPSTRCCHWDTFFSFGSI